MNKQDHEILSDRPYDIRTSQELDKLSGHPFPEGAQWCARVGEADDA